MTMTTLTGQPEGWYLCRLTYDKLQRDYPMFWDGETLKPSLGCEEDFYSSGVEVERFTNFRRLIEAPEPEPQPSERIVVKYRPCEFAFVVDRWRIKHCHDILDHRGRWVHWSSMKEADTFPTESAARAFAQQHADRQE